MGFRGLRIAFQGNSGLITNYGDEITVLKSAFVLQYLRERIHITRRLCTASLVWQELIDATISNLRLL